MSRWYKNPQYMKLYGASSWKIRKRHPIKGTAYLFFNWLGFI